MPNISVAPRKADIARFAAKAARSEIPDQAVKPLALVYAAFRKAQIAIGPGHSPLDAVFDALPPQYADNWLRKKRPRS